MVTAEEKDWLKIVRAKFDHPAIVLWRAAELRHIDNFLNRYLLYEPLLDLGCAEGNIADMLFKERKVFGLDNCWELLSQNKKGIYKALVLADACHMPYKNEQFGSIFSNCVIEHIPDINGLLNEATRILKKGGIFLFTVPSNDFAGFLFFTQVFKRLGLSALASWYKRARNRKLNHFHCYDHTRWEGILKAKGLILVEYQYYMSKKANFIWDFLAFIIFLASKLKLNLNHNVFLAKMVKAAYATSQNNNETGAGLLIVAQRKG